MELSGKCCIVTGSAMGIGRAVVEGLLRKGAKCVLADINWRVNLDYRISSGWNCGITLGLQG